MQHQHEREQPVIQILPKQILMDLLHEIRSPVITAHPLILDLSNEFPRVVMRLCSEAVRPVLALEEEVVFARGDSCMRMLFVERGILSYLHGSAIDDPKRKRNSNSNTSHPSGRRRSIPLMDMMEISVENGSSMPGSERSHESSYESGFRRALRQLLGVAEKPSFFSDDEELVKGGMWLSEAALWVQWDNHGTLMACTTGAMLELGVAEFIAVVTLFKDACARATLYSRAFSDELARLRHVSDILHNPFLKEYIPLDCENSPSRSRDSQQPSDGSCEQ